MHCKTEMDAQALRRRVLAKLSEQRALVRALLRLRAQLRGSLFERFAVCGKDGCVCRTGRRHGPYYVLSTRSGGEGGFAYLAPEQAEDAATMVRSHREFREGLRTLQRVNADVVVLLRSYQLSMAREGGRRIGLTADH